MLTAKDVAEYFLSRVDSESGDSLSNLKLQKLVYYAQGYHLALYGTPLFGDAIEAWQHGPVVPGLYRMYKQYGSQSVPVTDDFDIEKFNSSTRELLDEVFQVYGQFSAWKLRDMTHAESPWLDAYNLFPSATVTTESMTQYFRTQLVDA